MSFEVYEHDLHGRLGRLKTKHGVVETPTIAPVVNPLKTPFPIRDLREKFNCDLIITNAYLISKYYGEKAIELGVHELLDFPGPIMTDSGAYQILLYGYIDVNPDFILEYQRSIGSDIGVILDVPSAGAKDARYSVNWSVKETLRRALRAKLLKTEAEDMLLVAPIQGGMDLSLVRLSAHKLAKLNYDMYAVGSPTELMKDYRFDVLVDIMAVARMHVPLSKPLHLFGAGHPIMLSLAVALGYDSFDSASYILYAKDGRYITPQGTLRLEEMKELPCSCPVCSPRDISDIRELPKDQRISLLAQHNLYVILQEIRRIREAVYDGTLLRLLELRSRAHPMMYRALLKLKKYIKLLERCDYATKPNVRGIFFFDENSVLINPKVFRHKKWLKSRYKTGRPYLLLVEEPSEKPYHRDPYIASLLKELLNLRKFLDNFDVLFLSKAFILVPLELSETYPFSQHEYGSINLRGDLLNEFIVFLKTFIEERSYKSVLILISEHFDEKVMRLLKGLVVSSPIKITILSREGSLHEVKKIVKKLLQAQT